MPNPRTLRRGGVWPRLLLVVFGLAVGALIGIAGLRLARSDDRTGSACAIAPGDWFEQARALLGDYRDPCADFYWMPNPDDEFHHLIRLNNYGLNGPQYTLAKPADVFRVVIVGDSFAQGWQVPREDGFPWLLDRALTASASHRVEVINLSVDAYGTDRELLLYALLGWQFQPDLVILAMYTGNDIQDNAIDLEQVRYGRRLNRPFFTLDDGTLTLHASPTFDAAAYPESPVFAWLAALQAAQTPAPPPDLPNRPRVLVAASNTLEYPVQLGMYLPDDAHWTRAWALTGALVAQFRDLVENVQGVPFAVLIVPSRRAIHPEDWAATVEQVRRVLPALADADPTAPERRLAALLADQGIPALSLQAPLADWAAQHPGERLYYPGDGHFNAAGDRLAAAVLAEWLRDRGLVPVP